MEHHNDIMRTIKVELKRVVTEAILSIDGMPSNEVPRKSRTLMNLVLRRKMKELHQGDVIVPSGCVQLDDTQKEKLLALMQDYCVRDDTFTTRVLGDRFNLLSFYLERQKVIKHIITQITEEGDKYGNVVPQTCGTVSLHTNMSNQDMSLMELRLSVVKHHAERLLEANGYKMHPGQQEISQCENSLNLDREDVSIPSCESDYTHSDERDQIYQLVFSKLHTLSLEPESFIKKVDVSPTHSCEQPSSLHYAEADKSYMTHLSENTNMTVDLQTLIASNHLYIGRAGFDSNLKTVQVLQDGKPTATLERCLHTLRSLPNFPSTSKHTCVHIVPHKASFTNQQEALVLQSLVSPDLSQSQMTVGPITVQDNPKSSAPSAHQFYKSRYCQFKEASEMRNGGTSEDDTSVEILTQASLKIDILGTAHSSPLTLENTQSERGAESRLGAFIMYNTARLATLLQRFEQDVQQGTYPPLPAIASINWSLLREEEDWELVYVHLASFPEVVSHSVECVKPSDGRFSAKIHTHKVVNFLVMFCKCLSAHYNRYHILTGREKHHLPLMYARLYMMKAAHQVLLNCLYLIGIKPISYL